MTPFCPVRLSRRTEPNGAERGASRGGSARRSRQWLSSLSAMEKGDLAPDFELPDEDGTPRHLSDFAANGPVVLFFYPAALTYGCTIESCHFRDMKAEFEAVGATRVGISADEVEKQKRFSEKHTFDFPLLSDPDGKVATIFGVRRRFTKLSPTKRATFIIGPDLRVIDVLLLKGTQELEETMNLWKQDSHLRNYFNADVPPGQEVAQDAIPKREKPFLQRFFEGRD